MENLVGFVRFKFQKKVSDLESARLELAIVEKSEDIKGLSGLVIDAVNNSEINFYPIDSGVVESNKACVGRRFPRLVKEINSNFSPRRLDHSKILDPSMNPMDQVPIHLLGR